MNGLANLKIFLFFYKTVLFKSVLSFPLLIRKQDLYPANKRIQQVNKSQQVNRKITYEIFIWRNFHLLLQCGYC